MIAVLLEAIAAAMWPAPSATSRAIRGQRRHTHTVHERKRLAAGKADIENVKWRERLKQFLPIRLCDIVPGEKAPYPGSFGKP